MLKYSIKYFFHTIMSKHIKRNHNIHSLSSLRQVNPAYFESSGSCHLDIATPLRDNHDIFGEVIEEEYSPPFYKPKFDPRKESISPPFFKSKLAFKNLPKLNNDLETESIISGISEVKLIKSLSSSPSWSDDNDVDGCRRVQDELEQMDRVLRGIDPIPLHYDVDEYKQWMETFPTLSFFGKKEYGPYKIWKDYIKDEHTTTEKNSNTEFLPCASLIQYKKEIKKAVIHNIYENISIRLNNGSTPPSSSDFKKKQHKMEDVNKTQIYLNDCLKNSPFSDIVREKYTKNCFVSRHNSREDEKCPSPSFESLPIMVEESTRSSERSLNRYRNESSNGIYNKKSRKNIILPPIKNNWLQNSNQFRSISATPTYASLLSTKSMKLDSKLLSGKSRNIPPF